MNRRGMMLLALGMLTTGALRGFAADEVKGTARGLLVGKWVMAKDTLKQSVEFTKEGNMKMTTNQVEVNGKVVPLMKDGKPIDLVLEGNYKFTTDNTIETTLSNPFPETDKKPLTGKWQQVVVTKDTLTFVEGEGQQRKYERAK